MWTLKEAQNDYKLRKCVNCEFYKYKKGYDLAGRYVELELCLVKDRLIKKEEGGNCIYFQ